MTDKFVPIPRVASELVPVSPDELAIEKSRSVANVLLTGAMNWVALVDCYQHRSSKNPDEEILAETVVFDAEIELPQRPRYPISNVERIAVTFEKSDIRFPRVFALREEFPLVPHINLESFELPRSLCLFDLPYSEIKLRWGAVSFIERVRNWLADTAAGDLHKPDQQLEPLLSDPDAYIIFPPNFLTTFNEDRIEQVQMVVDEWQNKRFCFVAQRDLQKDSSKLPRFVVLGIRGSSQQHGPLRSRPSTISSLSDFLTGAKVDLLDQLRTRLSETIATASANGADPLRLGLIVLVTLPKTRDEMGTVESVDTYAFVCVRPEEANKDIFLSVGEIGERVGLWQVHEGRAGMNVPLDANRIGADVGLWMLAPCYPLSRNNAPMYSGTGQRIDQKLVAVGLGALGSQVFLNLVRTGDGEWTTIDKDILLPHNFIRHAAYGSMAGLSKSLFATYAANATIESPPISNAIVADILSPGESAGAVASALADASVILDFSASQAVARRLALDIDSNARRASAFLNPTGTDVIILAEDAERSVTLDSLEMQYYRLISSDESLAYHLRGPEGQVLFSASCRDVSSNILPELVARGAATASSALREILKKNEATISVWSGNEAGEIRRISGQIGRTVSEIAGDWTVRTDEIVLAKILAWRTEKLPVETGGALIGTYDMKRKLIYVADALPAPSDSIEKKTSFVRGSFGLKPKIESIKAATLENLQYVGEWHSHPAGHSADPSSDDRKLLSSIARMQHKDGNPALIVICGEDRFSWHTE